MGGGDTGSQYHSNTTVLPTNQQTNVDTILGDALKNYQSGGPQYYQGAQVAAPTAATQVGEALNTGYATGAGQQGVDAAQAANNAWLQPGATTNFASIPGYNDMVQGIQQQATQNLTDNTLPVIRDNAIMNGSYGGTSQQVGEALATARTNQGIGDSIANLDLGLYNTNVGAQSQAIAQAPSMYNLGLQPGETLQNVGDKQQAQNQAQIDADMKKWNYEQMAPSLNLSTLQGLTGQAGTYGGTSYGQGSASTGDDGGAQAMQAVGMILTIAAMMA